MTRTLLLHTAIAATAAAVVTFGLLAVLALGYTLAQVGAGPFDDLGVDDGDDDDDGDDGDDDEAEPDPDDEARRLIAAWSHPATDWARR